MQVPGTDPPDVPTLRLVGDIDLTSYAGLKAEILSIAGPLRLDCSQVDFMDSAGLRLIMQRLRVGPVTIVAPTPQMLRVFAVGGVPGWAGVTIEPGP